MFAAGTEVIIKNNFWNIEPEKDHPGLLEEMKQYAGLHTKIKSPYEYDNHEKHLLFRLEDCSFVWHCEWLEEDVPFVEIPSEEILDLFEEE